MDKDGKISKMSTLLAHYRYCGTQVTDYPRDKDIEQEYLRAKREVEEEREIRRANNEFR